MPQENETLKLRFKLKTGEEFEAQGDQAFISRQKEAFLNLVNLVKTTKNLPAITPFKTVETPPQEPRISAKPAFLRNRESYISQNPAKAALPLSEVWDKVVYSDGENLIIRRKSKFIKPQIAALIILGANKVINTQDTLSALELAKSLKLSGYLKTGQRLDRLLEGEIKENHLSYEGSKRNRLYRLSASGQAKAYIWAEKFLQEFS